MKNKILSVALAATLSTVALQATADTVSATVNAVAGLSPVLSLACTDVNFGVWRVPVRNTGGTSVITLTTSTNTSTGNTTAAASGNTTDVALASGFEVPTAGVCTVNGSNNPSQTIQTAISANTDLSFGASTHNNLTNPAQTAAIAANLTLAGVGVAINGTGTGTFRVTGIMTIPEIIAEDNYGGYKTSTGGTGGNGNAATITVTDVVPVT